MGGFSRKIVFVCALILLVGPIQQGLAEPNTVEIDVFEHVVCEQQLVTHLGTETIRMTGGLTHHVIFEGLWEGLADDDNGNHLDEVDTEMVALSLTGLSPSLGPVHMRLATGIQSIGMMEETNNDKSGLLEVLPFGPGSVDSFFDVYFEIDVAGQTFFGQDPMRLWGNLREKPAGHMDTYENQQQIILLDAGGNPTQLRLGPGHIRPNPPVEIDIYDNAICELELQTPDGSIVKTLLTGRTTERVFFEGPDQGSAYDDDGNGRDEVHTEMLALDLKGHNLNIGPVLLSLNSDIPAKGQMEEQADSNTGVLDVPPFFKDGRVDSFFDIYFELEIPAFGLMFHNQVPMNLRAVLWHKPAGPMTIYGNAVPIALFNQNGNPTGYSIGMCRYRPNPLIEVDALDTSIASVELIVPSGQAYVMDLMGQSKVHVFFERDFEGSANDDNGNGYDEVATELVELSLSGFDPEVGDMHLGLDPRMPTLGEIEETANTKTGRLDLSPFDEGGMADSFFDLQFEIEVAGMLMYRARPVLWRGTLYKKPAAPGDTYDNQDLTVLVDAYGDPTGFSLGTTWYEPIACGDITHPYPIGDLNLDCQVNYEDVAILANHWLECTRPLCP